MPFTGPGGSDPVAAINKLIVAAVPSEGDVLYGMQRQRTRILKRTAAGQSVNGGSFQAYSTAYAKQKAKYRPGGTVDLRGRNAPNMLQAIIAQAGSLSATGTDNNPRNSSQPAREGQLMFVDDHSALLARVHNEGEGRMPKRRFFDASPSEIEAITRDIGQRTDARLAQLQK